MALWQLNSVQLPASLSCVKSSDAILLKRDAVYLLQQDCRFNTEHVYVLQHDADARQVAVPSAVQAINEQQWVQLTLTHSQVIQCQ